MKIQHPYQIMIFKKNLLFTLCFLCATFSSQTGTDIKKHHSIIHYPEGEAQQESYVQFKIDKNISENTNEVFYKIFYKLD